MVWVLWPETNQRTLEGMNLVFASDSIWSWEAEREFKVLMEQNPQLVQAAAKGEESGAKRGGKVGGGGFGW